MIPRATYRLQFHKHFGFDDAAALAPYLAQLGVSHLYSSPYLKARPGSLHGYDIVDHSQLNPELGDDASFRRMSAALQLKQLGQILDVVPNHMGVGGADNPLWLDVLEWGQESVYAGWFDIEWDPDRRYLHEKVLVPLLGDQYGVELERGKLRLKFDEATGTLAVWAYDTHMLPIWPLHYGRVLGNGHAQLERLGDAFLWLTARRPQILRRAADLKTELAQLVQTRADVREALHAALNRFEGNEADAASWQALHDLIQEQHWRVAHFRAAADDINYRRFFDINELAGLRMELPEVFEHVHRRVLEWLGDGTLDGLRIDHIDGLQDPKAYLQRLRAHIAAAAPGRPVYVVVEKILAPHERLREEWPVEGTTGYDFANQVLGLLIDSDTEQRFTEIYAEFAGERRPFGPLVHECKLSIMDRELAGELNVLARDLARLARQNRRTADFTHNLLRHALKQLIACCTVYRTYIDAEGTISDADRRDIEWALAHARRSGMGRDLSVFDFLEQLLGGAMWQPRSGFSRQAALHCVMRLQQYSGPVMAKGLEDTAFYRYQRFIALNEVGGAPERFGISLAAFHKANAQRAHSWPHAMLATSTHDTKRGEDARARLAALSELPEEWLRLTFNCSRILRGPPGGTDAEPAPDRNDEYLFYQLLLGSWPVDLLRPEGLDATMLQPYAERLRQTMRKSLREARVHSTWAIPNLAYEEATLAFVDTALLSNRAAMFLATFLPFAGRIAALGAHNSLLQTVIKLTAPGMPDIYQGTELWDLSMVDPDNRRPVDYAQRQRLLDEVDIALERDRRAAMRGFFASWQDARFKLATLTTLLQYRRQSAELFAAGSYQDLETQGTQAECVCAFARQYEEQVLLSLTARFPCRLESRGFDADSTIALPENLQGHAWRDLLSGREFTVHDGCLSSQAVFSDLPAAVLICGPQ
ncbi:MAG: malto-oligosyltrehalose synthase [Steroidobacteraceae bacterium]